MAIKCILSSAFRRLNSLTVCFFFITPSKLENTGWKISEKWWHSQFDYTYNNFLVITYINYSFSYSFCYFMKTTYNSLGVLTSTRFLNNSQKTWTNWSISYCESTMDSLKVKTNNSITTFFYQLIKTAQLIVTESVDKIKEIHHIAA